MYEDDAETSSSSDESNDSGDKEEEECEVAFYFDDDDEEAEEEQQQVMQRAVCDNDYQVGGDEVDDVVMASDDDDDDDDDDDEGTGGGSNTTATTLRSSSSSSSSSSFTTSSSIVASGNKTTAVLAAMGEDQFKTVAQAAFVEKLLQGESVLAILGTGGGKTSAVLGTALAGPGLTIVVLPLKALLLDMEHKLVSMGTDKRKWARLTSDLVATGPTLDVELRLLLLSARDIEMPDHLCTVLQHENNRITRVVFDEAPVLIGSSFRKNLKSAAIRVRAMTTAPFVLLSATVPAAKENELMSTFGTAMSVVRAPTVRPNVAVSVYNVAPGAALREAKQLLGEQRDSLAMVFFMSIAECAAAAKTLGALPFHSKLEESTKRSNLQQWKSSHNGVLVATPGALLGIDADVELVVFVNGSYSLAELVQGLGRVGRRPGSRGRAIVLLEGGNKLPSSVSADMRDFVRDTRTCRRVAISKAFDTPATRWDGRCGLCDICRTSSSSSSNSSNNPAPDWLRETCSVTDRGASADREEEKRDAMGRVARARGAANWMEAVADKKKKKNVCFLCRVVGKRSEHGLKDCPLAKGRCFECFDLHRRDQCRYGAVLAKHKETMKQQQLCITCCLPVRIFDVQLHQGSGSQGSGCRFRDSTLHAAKLVYWLDKNRLPEEVRHMSFASYLDWLTNIEDGASKCLSLTKSLATQGR